MSRSEFFAFYVLFTKPQCLSDCHIDFILNNEDKYMFMSLRKNQLCSIFIMYVGGKLNTPMASEIIFIWWSGSVTSSSREIGFQRLIDNPAHGKHRLFLEIATYYLNTDWCVPVQLRIVWRSSCVWGNTSWQYTSVDLQSSWLALSKSLKKSCRATGTSSFGSTLRPVGMASAT